MPYLAISEAPRIVLVCMGLIAGVFVIGAVVIPWIRRRFHPGARREDGTRTGGFSLEELERLRRSGGISDQEFRLLRRQALGLDGPAGKMDDCALSRPVGGDDDDSTTPADEHCAGEAVDDKE